MDKQIKNQTKICKFCKTEIPANAKICPNCRKKQTSMLRKTAKILLLFCIAAFLLTFCSNVQKFKNENNKDKNPRKISEGSSLEQEKTGTSGNVFQTGDVVETENLRISFLSAEQYVSDNEFLQPKEGDEYWKFTFKVENISDSDQAVSSLMDWECFADNAKADQTYIGDDNGLDATLSSGRETQGSIYFEIPQGSSQIELEYKISYFSDNKIIFKAK